MALRSARSVDARYWARRFEALRVHHDIVFVDQRGTGHSAPLDCPIYDRANLQPYLDPMWPVERIRECRRHPDRVRRFVLNGVVPPDQVFFSWVPQAIARELAVIDPDHVVDGACDTTP